MHRYIPTQFRGLTVLAILQSFRYLNYVVSLSSVFLFSQRPETADDC
jgi:hypothetical protein